MWPSHRMPAMVEVTWGVAVAADHLRGGRVYYGGSSERRRASADWTALRRGYLLRTTREDRFPFFKGLRAADHVSKLYVRKFEIGPVLSVSLGGLEEMLRVRRDDDGFP